MTFSKLTRNLSVLILGLAVAACSTQSDKKKEYTSDNVEYGHSPGTNFIVNAVKANSTSSVYSQPYGAKIIGKTYNFEACINDPSNTPISLPNLPFEIDSGDGNIIPVSTDRRGCFVWSETHKINFFAKETYIQFRRVIRGKGVYKGEVYVELAIHPWLDGAASVLDLRYNPIQAGQPVEKIGTLSVKGSTLTQGEALVEATLKGASFEYLGNDLANFEVTPFLGLKVAHKYRVKITPSIFRRSIAKYWEAVSLLTGVMKVDFTVLREDENPATQFDPKNVITTLSWTGNMQFGDLNADISLKFDNVSDITSRTVALVTLTPQDEIADIGQMSFYGAMKPGQLGSINLYPILNHNATQVNAAYAAKLQASPRLKTTVLELFQNVSGAETLNLEAVTLRGRDDVNVKALVEDYLRTGSFGPNEYALRAALCEKMLDSSETRAQVDRCREIIGKNQYLTFARRGFVESLNSARPLLVGMPTVDTLTMTAGIGESYKKSTTVSQSVKAGFGMSAGLGLGLDPLKLATGFVSKVLKFFGASLGFNVSLGANRDYGVAWVSNVETTTGVSTTPRTKTVTAEGQTFAIDANVRNCFLVRRNPEAFNGRFGKKVSIAPKSAVYCSEHITREVKHETYYLVGQKIGTDGSVFTDNASNSATPWRMFIRGKPVMNMFSEILSQPRLEFRVQEMKEDALSENFKEFYVTQEFPGVFSEE